MTTPTPWLKDLAGIPLSERRAVLESLVVAEFKRELMMDETDVLPHHESYFELGLTSLGATDTRTRLEQVIGRPLDSAYLFNNPTVGHLVDFLVAEVLPEFFTTEPPRPMAAQQPDAPTKDLVDDMLRELYQS
ncbi:acyl carrier protein [Streptomyces sp. NPDC051776]|uniref:acyl carrier protein n=1 Tax=Streptomyces sp. NPDC051776 TaxID=3155414 RepID=UPI003414769A